jgi:hypothetical protein
MARIDRLEAAAQPAGIRARPDAATIGSGGPALPAGARLKWIGVGVCAGVILGAAALAGFLQGAWPVAFWGRPETLPVSTLNAPLPVPSTAEIALTRGQALFARGQLHQALAVLAEVPDGDPLRARADELVSAIQRQLLAAAGSRYRHAAEDASRRP